MTAPHRVRGIGGTWALSALAGLGTVLGLAVGATVPETYSAEARVVVTAGGDDASPLSPSTRQAREQAEDYAGWIRLHTTDGTWRPAGAQEVGATVEPGSTTVSIEVLAGEEDTAVAGADHVAGHLEEAVTTSSGRNNPDNALGTFRQRAPRLAEARTALDSAQAAHARAEAGNGSVPQTRDALEEARAQYNELRIAQDADAALYRQLYAGADGSERLQRLGQPTSLGGDRENLLLRGGVIGLTAGLAGGVALKMLHRQRVTRAPGRAGESDAVGV